jgi:holo-[acyl-carrier-protein] synthase
LPVVRGGAIRLPHLAGRFAAKEAAMKALGTGHARGVLWKDVEVVRVSGPPVLHLHGEAARVVERMNARRSLLTTTHSETLAMAQGPAVVGLGNISYRVNFAAPLRRGNRGRHPHLP